MGNVIPMKPKLPQIDMPVFTMMHKGMEWNLPVSMVQAVVEGKRPATDIPDEFTREILGDWLQWKLEEVL